MGWWNRQTRRSIPSRQICPVLGRQWEGYRQGPVDASQCRFEPCSHHQSEASRAAHAGCRRSPRPVPRSNGHCLVWGGGAGGVAAGRFFKRPYGVTHVAPAADAVGTRSHFVWWTRPAWGHQSFAPPCPLLQWQRADCRGFSIRFDSSVHPRWKAERGTGNAGFALVSGRGLCMPPGTLVPRSPFRVPPSLDGPECVGYR